MELSLRERLLLEISLTLTREILKQTFVEWSPSCSKPTDEEIDILLKKINSDPIVVLEKPLTLSQIREQMDEDGWIEGVISMDIGEFTDHDLEGVLDIMSERLCDSPCLSDINYDIVGHDGKNTLYVKVSGDISDIANYEEEE